MSYSYTRTVSFTITHARHLSSKVAADMYLSSAYYGWPRVSDIANLAEELAILLRDGYVATYEFGFKKNSRRYLTWLYTVQSDGTLTSDDRAGKLLSSFDVSDATYFNFLSYSDKWWSLSQSERDAIKSTLPVQRGTGDPPIDGAGYWVSNDRNYYSGGIGLGRATFQPVG